MKSDPLGANQKKDQSKEVKVVNHQNEKIDRGKEFERKQEDELRQMMMIQEKGSEFKETRVVNFNTKNKTIMPQPQQQVQQQVQQQTQRIQTTENQRQNFTKQLVFPPSYNQPTKEVQEVYQEPPPKNLDIETCGMKREFVQPGETLRLELPVKLQVFQTYQAEGRLYVTNYQIAFESLQIIPTNRKDYFYMPLGYVNRVERILDKKQQELSTIEINFKDGKFFKLYFGSSQINDSYVLWQLIYKLAFVETKQQIFAFTYYSKNSQLEQKYQGWDLYKIETEFERQKLDIAISEADSKGKLFKYIDNTNGSICPTYFEKLVVPSRVSLECVLNTAKFRTSNRIPHLVYGYQYGSGIISLWRSSQCKVGMGNNRCPDDEHFLNYIAAQQPDEEMGQLKIFDARPQINAYANQVAGKGFENPQFYKNSSIKFLDIHNIHKVRDSYKKIQHITLFEQNYLMSNMEIANWYDHIVAIINGAVQCAIAMTTQKQPCNILIHCSDGWDRTSQLCSLTQIMIDPFYRTIQGFMILVQKDWVFSGHQFFLRSGVSNKHFNDEQRSPIFPQFLDCVYQLFHLYPLSFEFNVRFLTFLAYHYQSGLFGTFLADSHKEILTHKINTDTVSLWSKILEQKEKFLNPFYSSKPDVIQRKIIPQYFSGGQIIFWKEHFNYFALGSADFYDLYPEVNFTDENINETHNQIKKENVMLRQAVFDHERQNSFQQNYINELNKIIQESEDQSLKEKLESLNLKH